MRAGLALVASPFPWSFTSILHDSRQFEALRRLLIVAGGEKRSRDQEQTHDTAQLGHGETPFRFAPRDNRHNPFAPVSGMTYGDSNSRFVNPSANRRHDKLQAP